MSLAAIPHRMHQISHGLRNSAQDELRVRLLLSVGLFAHALRGARSASKSTGLAARGRGGRGGGSGKKPAAPSTYDSLAGRSKVLAPSASSRGRGLEPHSCRSPLPSARADPLPVCYASSAKAAQERGWRPTLRHPAIAASSGVVRACAISNWDPKIQHAAVLRDRQPCLGMARASPPPRPPHPRPARGPACTMVRDRLGKPQGAASLIGEHRNQIYIANPLCPRPHGREGPFALSIKIEPATLHAPPGPVRCPHEQGVRGDSAARNT